MSTSAGGISEMKVDIEWIKRSLTKIETSIDNLANAYVSAKEYAENHKDHEDRLRNIEKQNFLWKGGLAALSVVSPVVLKFLKLI